MVDAEHYRNELGKIIGGRRWIVAFDITVAAARFGAQLLELGAEQVLAIGANRGTGDLPEDPRMEIISLGTQAETSSLMGGIRAAEHALLFLDDDTLSRVESFDPDGTCQVVRPLFSTAAPVAQRGIYGGRPESWVLLEDKTRIDAFWDAADVERAPTRIVPLELEALLEAHQAIDQGLGSVWVADNRDGWHGGAELIRWVQGRQDATDAHRYLADKASYARVMPFLDGIPCSIHGIVWGDEVAVLRPCEMMVFRVPLERRFAYGMASTFWLPPEGAVAEMRDVARRVGQHLRRTESYRGCFTVDGVLTRDGFRPTELNPRYGAALSHLAAGVEGLPLYLLHLAMVEDIQLDYRLPELESLIVRSSMDNPRGRSHRLVEGQHAPRKANLVVGDVVRFARDEEDHHVSAELGPSASGSILILSANPDCNEMGPPLAPTMARAYAFLDQEWALGIGPLEPARPV